MPAPMAANTAVMRAATAALSTEDPNHETTDECPENAAERALQSGSNRRSVVGHGFVSSSESDESS